MNYKWHYYGSCKHAECPFRGCMDDKSCKLVNMGTHSPNLVEEHAKSITYCDRPQSFVSEVLQRQKERRGYMSLEECYAHIPNRLPPEIIRYAHECVFKRHRYIFYSGRSPHQYGYCSHCQQEHVTSGLKHNQKAICPNCNSECTAKASGRGRGQLVDKAYFTYYLKSAVDPQAIVAIGMYAVRDYSGDYHGVQTKFAEKSLYVFRPGIGGTAYVRPVYYWKGDIETYGYSLQWHVKCQFMRDNMAQAIWDYSRDSIAEAVKDTPFRYSTWEQYRIGDMTSFFDLYARYPSVEYLTKLGFRDLVIGKLEGTRTYQSVNWRGKSVLQVLKLTKQELLEIKRQKIYLSFEALRALQLGKKHGLVVSPAEAVSIASDLDHTFDEAITLWQKRASHVSLTKFVSYLTKQISKRFHKLYSVFYIWRDYLKQCEELKYDLTDDRILFPKDLDKAHGEATTQLKVRANKHLEKQIRRQAKKLEKYTFKHSGFLIRPAATLKELIAEGVALKHCVGTYADIYAKGETTILVIRKQSEPEQPFFTMEVRKGQVTQCYGLSHCRPDDELQRFIDLYTSSKKIKGLTRAPIIEEVAI